MFLCEKGYVVSCQVPQMSSSSTTEQSKSKQDGISIGVLYEQTDDSISRPVCPVTPCTGFKTGDDDSQGSEEHNAALLLTSFAGLAKKEVEGHEFPTLPNLTSLLDNSNLTENKNSVSNHLPASTLTGNMMLAPRFPQLCSVSEKEYKRLEAEEEFENSSRLRAVSIDSMYMHYENYSDDNPETIDQINEDASNESISRGSFTDLRNYLLPSTSMIRAESPDQTSSSNKMRSLHPSKRLCQSSMRTKVVKKAKKNSSSCSKLARKVERKCSQSPLQPQRNLKKHTIKNILRKKFSWKNYPELEAFLVANREEYLRHSAMNYTSQQKQYNNRLTERLLEVASENGYVFDNEEFSFVTVRDRIRCYFKSYVQSSRKRGIIIGYAARRAGLVSEKEIQRSAGIEGKIVVPAQCWSKLSSYDM